MNESQRKSLPQPVQKFVMECAARCPEVERVILFGSRARGDSGDRSDFDLAVVAPTITHARWSKFAIDMEERLPSLCGIDMVLLSEKTPPPLKETIERQGIVIYDQAA